MNEPLRADRPLLRERLRDKRGTLIEDAASVMRGPLLRWQ
jgi:hypothetical protein